MSLKNIILERIKSSKQPLLFRDFMQMALYYPLLGYYSGAREKISPQGDFITATSQTSLFARTFARQFATIISQLGSDCSVIEFGAGNGKFAADCINELKSLSNLPKHYIIIELSNDLRLRQQQYIKENIPHLYDKFIWLDKLPEQKLKAIVFANELLDAMPVDVFRFMNNKLVQQGVTSNGDNFKFSDMLQNDVRFEYESGKILDDGITFDDGYTSEINTWIRPWIKSLHEVLSQGIVFLCDYGYHRSLYYSKERYMGTLACYYQHQVNFEPFINIGEQDITAHVDFTTVAEAAIEVGFQLDGYMTQANFLKRAGISEVFSDISQHLGVKQYLKYSNDIKDLLLNDKLAEVFKVIAFSLDFDVVLDVFDNQDNIDYLL
ncbi:class I SAM-dependent methyltransferase [Francisella hispaniensis]|uniref:class I SAM-dependent methyltransferase n=1 Tax=Francisella hispaniensis TaxID=622488 RepID=UPI00190600B7|nr:SAM-dependent methyltransferase [Francisella hispaniensis]MBK2357561.1 SAM-dependent methyltransferase [Francisella hispaniensis]